MSEIKCRMNLVSGIECKNGRHFVDLSCLDKDGKPVQILIDTTNQCEYLIGGESDICVDCEIKELCEISEPEQIKIGGSIIIVQKDA